MLDLPFSADDFFGVFVAYNEAVWPAAFVLPLLGLLAVGLAFRGGRSHWVAGFLAALWGWTGVAYHLVHFSSVNPAAWLFGVLFVGQALLFLWHGVLRRRLRFAARYDAAGVAGRALLLYALVLYPVLGHLGGHVYPATPTFGAPCPVVIYTFGLLLLARPRVPAWLLAIPFAWGVLGLSAVWAFGVRQDAGLIVAAVVGTALIVRRNRGLARQEGAEAVVLT